MTDNGLIERKIGEIIKKDTVIWERPEVLDQDLNPLTLLQLTMLDDIQVSLTKLNEHFKKEEFEGKTDPRDVNVTDQVQAFSTVNDYPYKPWIGVSIFSRGPDRAYIQLNYRDDWIPLDRGDTLSKSYAGADTRLEFIRYKCDPGRTASVTIIGKY